MTVADSNLMQVRIVGAGPAGLMAADILSAGGARVTLIDHRPSPGRKFLLAGRGGLNLTHSEALDQFLQRYGSDRAFLEPAIRAFPPSATVAWCEALGIRTFTGSSGRIFPASMKASPLLRAWLRKLAEQGVVFHGNTPWQGFDDTPTVLALGGASWPELGSDASWLQAFAEAGVAVQPFVSSNGRQRVAWSQLFADRHAGTPLKNIAIRVGGTESRGELMLAREGIEGGAIYALSRQLREPAAVEIDLKPGLTDAEVAARLGKVRRGDSRSTALRKAFNLSPAAIALMRERGAESPKHVRLETLGPFELRRAISSAGGVAREEVDDHFRLRKVPNTYVTGEMLDWDAPTGGYLLQACFATAHCAATDLLRRMTTGAGF
ncbi:MAG: TIGR03862 family flavoprotein [Proteobacteria bacterium]|nr:TIGR03862 family flavoprotein [Pseudomonadota bacterium]